MRGKTTPHSFASKNLEKHEKCLEKYCNNIPVVVVYRQKEQTTLRKDTTMYEEMKRMFDGRFWTKDNELAEDLESNGIEVLDMDYEGICVWDADEEEEVYIRLSRANTTVWMMF